MIQRLLTLILISFALQATLTAQTLDDLSRKDVKLLNKTFAAYSQQNFDKARKLMNKFQSTSENKNISEALLLDAHIYYAVRDLSKAKDSYLAALDMAPEVSPITRVAQIGISRSVERMMWEEDNKPRKPRKKVATPTSKKMDSVKDVAFAVIEKVPVYPGCDDSKSNQELKKCMQLAITAHINQNFDTGVAKIIGLEGKIIIAVQFKINTDGNVTGIHARSLNPILEEEAIRVVSALDLMQPGTQRGEPVGVIYALPIIFQVQ